MSDRDLAFGPRPPDDSGSPVASGSPAGASSRRLDLDGHWNRVSPRYVVVEIVGSIVFGLVAVTAAVVLWFLADVSWALWVGGAIALASIINLIFEPRRVRSIGYQLRADDLLFRRGILFQRFVSVPYGRMQLVDITRGPIARWLGLADLKFVTAAASTGVSIPGLPDTDAEQLRDRLVELAESRRAGL
ncbi:MAG: PH domain-containing protein [Cryobacterium sp.]